MIDVQDVFLKYPGAKQDTIRGISFNVKKGEIFGFLGPSGAGKSTMQKILTGVLRNYRGRVNVLGIEVKNRTRAFYENIGVDFEFPNFYGKFTAMENLKYFASLYKAKTSGLMSLLERVGLSGEADKKVQFFSKGMKMRLGFVRCLMHDPGLLFLDEPTNGLDPANARTLKHLILEQKAMGKTIILTTHNMHDAEELCGRVAFIVDGKIEACDTPYNLRKSGADTKVDFGYAAGGHETRSMCLLSELSSSEEFQSALKAGTLTDIHSKEQTLEDVFITVTGRRLQ